VLKRREEMTQFLNNTVAGKDPTQDKIVNEEGSLVFLDRADRELYLHGSALRPRNSGGINVLGKDSFYHSTAGLIKMLDDRVDRAVEKEGIEYVMALAWYLGQVLGSRLAPTLMLTRLIINQSSVLLGNEELRHRFGVIIRDVFTRPDFLANALSYYKWRTESKTFTRAPNFFLDMLRDALERMKPHTLKAQKMLRRKTKLKHLIIALKPNPKRAAGYSHTTEAEMSALYKAIIEDGPLSKLTVDVDAETGKVQAEKLVSVLSDTSVTEEQVGEFVAENISKLPINEVIRNLGNIEDEQGAEIYRRLDEIFESGQDKVLNPFDLVFLEGECRGYNVSISASDYLIGQLDRVLTKHVTIPISAEKPLVMLDISGSMYPESFFFGINSGTGRSVDMRSGLRNACKVLALMPSLFSKNKGTQFWNWGTSVYNVTGEMRQYSKLSPNRLARTLFENILDKRYNEGTYMETCARTILSQISPRDLLVIITDETSFDRNDLTYHGMDKVVNDFALNGRTVIVNVSPNLGTVVKQNGGIVRTSGMDPSVYKVIQMLVDWNSFKKDILDRYEERMS
jgi:hypothetical protein